MITTVTTTTTAMTTVTAASLTLIVVMTLIALLVNKEFMRGLRDGRAKQLSRTLNVAIVPLVVVFITSVAFRVAETLR
jgi:hypothetical protein